MTQDDLKEWARCAYSCSYFLDKYGYIFDITKNKVDRLTLFEYQKDVLDKYEKNKNNIILKSRQTGISVITAGYTCWRLLFHEDERILIVANDGNAAVRFLETVRQYLSYLPKLMLPDLIPTNNTRQIVLSNGSFVKAVASGNQAGRGETLTLLIMDEVAFIENADEIWMGAGLALSSKDAKCIMISTPNGTGNLYHSIWTGAQKKENDFVCSEVKWSQHAFYAKGLEERIDEHGRKYMWSFWYEKQCEKFKFDRIKIAQELDLSFEGSNAIVIENYILNKYEKSIEGYKPTAYFDYKEPGSCFVERETNFWIFEMPIPGANYILSCLPPGEKVLTNNGLKNIEDVIQIDMLVNENGQYVNIINRQEHLVINEDTFEIQLDNTYRTTTFTKEHPILVSQNTKLKRPYDIITKTEGKRYWDFDFNYIKANNLKINDWVKVPNMYKKETNININDKWEFDIKDNVRKDFIINSPIDNKDFWWFVGLWLGDGWITKSELKYSYVISVCFNKQEYYYLEKCKSVIEMLFKRTPSITECDSTYNITFNSKELYYFLLKNFGQYSYGKKISEWVKFIPAQYKKELIKGYFDSDGCWVKTIKNKKINSKISFVSINLELLESIQDILFSIGIISSLNKLRDESEHIICGRIYDCKKCYNLCLANFDSLKLIELLNDKEDIKLNKFKVSDFQNINKRIISSCHMSNDEEFIYFKIKNIIQSKFTGIVYNFECDTHTFMCHHLTTHNCDVSRGDGADYSTIQILNADTLVQSAEYQGKIAPDVFATVIMKAAIAYNKAFVVIEGNNHGLVPALQLRNVLHYDVDRIYHSKSFQKIYVRYADYDYVDANEEIPGFQTTSKTRPLLMSCIQVHMRESQVKIFSKRLLNEFKTFIYNGERPEHAQGYHDDLIFAFAIGLHIRETEYNNIFKSKDFYKAMLDGIGHSSNHKDITPATNANLKNGIAISNGKGSADDTDLRWLYGPIPG